jgi:mannose/cellobiose epimerase-like protein (N-acyl-D-glucosamine 2-epimerase family)
MTFVVPRFTHALARDTAAEMRRKAEVVRRTAGANGCFGDGGAAATLREVEAFEAGMSNRWPNDEWCRTAAAIAQRESDPEYAKYLELKKRFEK